MAMASYKHGKPIMVEYTPGADVDAGDVIVTGGSPRVAHQPLTSGELSHLAASGGVYEMTGDAEIAADVGVYWDASAEKVSATDDSAANAFFGFLVTACAADNGTCLVRHSPQAVIDDGD